MTYMQAMAHSEAPGLKTALLDELKSLSPSEHNTWVEFLGQEKDIPKGRLISSKAICCSISIRQHSTPVVSCRWSLLISNNPLPVQLAIINPYTGNRMLCNRVFVLATHLRNLGVLCLVTVVGVIVVPTISTLRIYSIGFPTPTHFCHAPQPAKQIDSQIIEYN